MPKLSAVIADRATVSVALGREAVTVTYRPQALTPQFQEQVVQAQGNTAVRDALYGPVAQLVIDWDLTRDDGSPIDPSDPEALRTAVPSALLFAIIRGIMEDLQAAPLSGNGSNNGSTPRADLEPRLSTTAS